ncbi:hypothetical protein SAMN05443247_11584 [Bradyrhizobium erythrophlei]|nr:hypothetical protein SAMN05443247_11584 [Bradyrhizobium erythrophlei]
MNPSFLIGMRVAVVLLGLMPIPMFAFDVKEATDQLAQSLAEDIQRQRLRAQREDAEEARRAKLPDLSQFGTPVDRPRAARPHRSMDCTTIDMGGNSATHCD